MKTYIANAFSLQMIDGEYPQVKLLVERCSKLELADSLKNGAESCISHYDTAYVLGNVLGMEVACNRQSIKLQPGDTVYVAQVCGGRLQEGTTELPSNLKFKYFRVRMEAGR